MGESKNVNLARSKENGVVFYSNKFSGRSYEATRNLDGSISTREVSSFLEECYLYMDMLIKDGLKIRKKAKTYLIVSVVNLILAIISTIITERVSIGTALMYFNFTVLSNLIEFYSMSYDLKKGELQSTGRYHATEHMVINAYVKHQRVPTMEEVKACSRYNSYCGSVLIIRKIFSFTLLSIVIAFSGFVKFPVYILMMVSIIFIIKIEDKAHFLNYLQVLVTNKPTENELEVALEGLKFFAEMEEDDENEYGNVYIFIEC